MAIEKDSGREQEIARLVDKRIAELFGSSEDDFKQALGKDPGVMATPSVLSIVRATAYAHC